MTATRRLRALRAASVFLLLALPAQASKLGDLTKSGDMAGVTAALDEGADINEVDGVTALYIAIESGNLELTRLLIERGADVNLPVKLQRTPLYAAIKGGFAEIVTLLLDSGADPNQVAKSLTPLHVAADEGCLQCVVDLVDAGAEVNALNSNGNPPLHFAKRKGFDEIATYLESHGAAPPVAQPILAMLASADVDAGRDIFNRTCVKCHLASKGASNPARHNLWDIVGRESASENGGQYSQAMKDFGGTWTFEALNAFIAYPSATLPGTDMSFAGLLDDEERADIIAYLRTLSDTPTPLP
jgi:cytochrome c